jgi:hypothetical protein
VQHESVTLLITVKAGEGRHEEVRVAIEAKSWASRFSPERTRSELKAAKANRGAAAGLFIAESADVTPDGLAFGQVGSSDFFLRIRSGVW